jgi:hypothetical protein
MIAERLLSETNDNPATLAIADWDTLEDGDHKSAFRVVMKI